MSTTLRVLEFFKSNQEFNNSILIGCYFEDCKLIVNNTEIWYCTFNDAFINLDGFRELWKEVWSGYIHRLNLFLTEFENTGSGLWLVSTIQKYNEISEKQLEALQMWQPLFCTCEGRLNCCHPKKLVRAESNALAESVVMTERQTYLGEEYVYDDEDYDDED